jgi:hypothetical protein
MCSCAHTLPHAPHITHYSRVPVRKDHPIPESTQSAQRLPSSCGLPIRDLSTRMKFLKTRVWSQSRSYLVLRLIILASIQLLLAKPQPLVHNCSLVELPIRPHHHLYLVRRLWKILNSHLFPILLDNARDKNQILVLRELVQKYKVLRVHRRVDDVLLLIRILGAWHRLQPLCAVFGRLVEPGRDEGGWYGWLSADGVWRWLVNFGACGQIVVGIGCDPEVPARVAVAVVGVLKGGVEILWLLVSGTCSIDHAVLTSLVMLLSRTKSA